MYVLLYLEFYAPTFTSAEILRAAELSPSRSDLGEDAHFPKEQRYITAHNLRGSLPDDDIQGAVFFYIDCSLQAVDGHSGIIAQKENYSKEYGRNRNRTCYFIHSHFNVNQAQAP